LISIGGSTIGETYAKAGVNLDAAEETTGLIAKLAKTTMRPEVLSGIGFFGGFFELGEYRKPVLVSSIDGVGTKLKVAIDVSRHDGVGRDIVNHCVNDIFVCGAEPLFFLDYIAVGKLLPERVAEVVRGMAIACRENGCALIGGETAEMPGIYQFQDYDLAGCIIGVVEKDSIITGQDIQAGDAIVGLPSSGLHTNGFSMIRRIFKLEQLRAYHAELGATLGEALLEPHRSYYPLVKPLLPYIKGMAHITGGGLPGNVPRVLPEALTARFDTKAWQPSMLFEMIKKQGRVDWKEMYRVFNMGVGLTVFCAPENVSHFTGGVPGALVIGEVIPQTDERRVILD
jgi:phosphoribosylformylglycinamidine cyclo-ligase